MSNAEAQQFLDELSEGHADAQNSDAVGRLSRLDARLKQAIHQNAQNSSASGSGRALTYFERAVADTTSLQGLPEAYSSTGMAYLAEIEAQLQVIQRIIEKAPLEQPVAIRSSLSCIATTLKKIEGNRKDGSPDLGSCSSQVTELLAQLDCLPAELDSYFTKGQPNAEKPAPAKAADSPSTLCEWAVQFMQKILSGKPPPVKVFSADDRSTVMTALNRMRELARAVGECARLACKNQKIHTDLYQQIASGAQAIKVALFPELNPASTNSVGVRLGVLPPSPSTLNSSKGRPSFNNVGGLAEMVARELSYKSFGSVSFYPLPITLVNGPASAKHPIVTKVVTEFVPTSAHPFATDAVTVYLIGKDLDAAVSADPLLVAQPDPAKSATPVVVVTGPTVVGGVAQVTVKVDPTYKSAFALQLKTKSGDTLITPPILVPRLELDDAPGSPTIRHITGSASDPTQQQKDEYRFIGVKPETITPEVLKSKIEDKKPEEKRTIDVNVGIGGKGGPKP
jgi:hypothetical protein